MQVFTLGGNGFFRTNNSRKAKQNPLSVYLTFLSRNCEQFPISQFALGVQLAASPNLSAVKPALPGFFIPRSNCRS